MKSIIKAYLTPMASTFNHNPGLELVFQVNDLGHRTIVGKIFNFYIPKKVLGFGNNVYYLPLNLHNVV